MNSITFRLALIVTLSLLTLAAAPAAYATNQVVSDCGDTGGANTLRAKINAAQSSGGGIITFTCNTAIVLNGTALPLITTKVTIDGGNTITLSGGNASRILYVTGTGDLTLKNITLTKGQISSDDGGALRNDGRLTVSNSKFLDNHVLGGGSGGAIITHGITNISNSEFANNTATNGGALYIKWQNASTVITGSNFHSNETLNTLTGWGGAILVFDGPYVIVSNSVLNNNVAGWGGAAHLYKGGVSSSLVFYTSNVYGNIGRSSGGGVFSDHSYLEINDTNVYDNYTATDPNRGGGIYNRAGTLIVNSSAIYWNSAGPNSKGETYGGGIYNTGTAKLTNVTLSENYSHTRGGGLYNSGTVEINNATFYRNCCGGGISNDGTAAIKNSIFVVDGSNTNCGGVPLSGSFNLSNDGTCGFGAGHDNVNPLLGPLTNNGGKTATHLPSSNPKSPAIDTGQCSGVYDNPIITDQREVARPQGVACDVGAVEVEVVGAPPPRRLWLPFIVR